MSFNKVLLLGHLTRDPQLTYTPSQTAVCDIGLATNRTFSKQDGSKGEEVCFVDCRAWGRTAENINKYLGKGSPIFIEGRLTYDSWTGQDHKKHSKLRVTIETFQFIGGKQGEGQEAPRQRQTGGYRKTARDEPDPVTGRLPDPDFDPGQSRPPMDDDDIPF